ncbi:MULTISPECIES: carboxymuconolactone decarboxylase family protein [Ferroplasma]|jgi:AhpD family alkylhydroperoxidase|uniref:DNA-binding protein n=2 Tax=Ferroplasma TaxID=74968 RepID=S0AS56_FERAC|nr:MULTISPECIES: carboxymuconolactone decarboxylase family protein [Ferroplasma]MCL4349493.1 carboxymuconolactone decarboxylase family protein [Candidatus Thermoplasmatota archaeon]AGO60950.1 DNA-binding protein [Ferroplasma acidarmanus Fer1]ARD85691.1 DNA-binding protein [Ferroplasma acidiphilum]NOL60296.1 carboxymuconolactone decarboxylase family protein [Ferroplasma acidiphilum]WMT52830.1 MAG: carboxymuconolactone decarboxylase family protein [Ferroplasma acidiphilum]
MDAGKKMEEVGRVMQSISEDNKEYMGAFMGLMQNTMRAGTLSVKQKELIALALSIAARCEWCISYHVKSAIEAGATKKELMETGYVVVLMYGSQAMMELNSMLDAIEKFYKK